MAAGAGAERGLLRLTMHGPRFFLRKYINHH